MIETTLRCNECNQELDYSIDSNKRIGVEFIVVPCMSCMDDSMDEGRQEGHDEGYKEGLGELFENNRLRDPNE